MTPPDNASTARPDRRSSPKLATGVILFALAGVGLFATENILGSIWFRVHLSGIAAIFSLAYGMLGLWYFRPPWWVYFAAIPAYFIAERLSLLFLLFMLLVLIQIAFTEIPWWIAALPISIWLIEMLYLHVRRPPKRIMVVLSFVMCFYFFGQALVFERSRLDTITGITAGSRVYWLVRYFGAYGPGHYRIYDCNSLGLLCQDLHQFDNDPNADEAIEIDPETGMPQVIVDGRVIYTVPVPEPPR